MPNLSPILLAYPPTVRSATTECVVKRTATETVENIQISTPRTVSILWLERSTIRPKMPEASRPADQTGQEDREDGDSDPSFHTVDDQTASRVSLEIDVDDLVELDKAEGQAHGHGHQGCR